MSGSRDRDRHIDCSGAVDNEEEANEALEEPNSISSSQQVDGDDTESNSRALFKMQLTPRDVEDRRLLIPFDIAGNHLPPDVVEIPGPGGTSLYEILISNARAQNNDWIMTLIRNPGKQAFMITRGWQGFVDWYNLEAMDLIRFYRPEPRPHGNHYLIECVESEKLLAENNVIAPIISDTNIPEFKKENKLFDITFSPLMRLFIFISEETFRKLFPGNEIPAQIPYKAMRLKFTDAGNKDWCIKIELHEGVEFYELTEGWKEFVNHHNFISEDEIEIYKPVQPLHSRHFLIKKRDEVWTNLTQHRKEKPDGGDDTQGDGGSSKGKEIAVGLGPLAPIPKQKRTKFARLSDLLRR
ncbi:uncharacterized protein LOC130794812 [Actinidia eriantha]|uniref:uncharacterized protein LOC130794812 n=1 Tax=Actinidia eriantha TaxID=165200 RepID=UPI00258499C2|nr:uncharacterized protein LOC130794812 [Actinidia eriantha]